MNNTELETQQQKFWSKVKKSADGCWLWMGTGASGGYGSFKYDGKMVGAHRLSWTLSFGPPHDGLFVLHKCDVRACVNPSHLFLGTQKDNVLDCCRKGRKPHGEKHHAAKLSGNQVSDIRFLSRFFGFKNSDIANAYLVSTSTINLILKKRIWV